MGAGAADCGENLTWTLTDGVLTVSGSGAMTNWSKPAAVPWYSSRSTIEAVVIGQGVTGVGNYAFYNCTKLKTVSLPQSLAAIGRNAFQGCKSLETVTIPQEVTDIGSAAFYECTGLTQLTLGDGLIAIGDEAFFGCSGLTRLDIPAGVSEIGMYAFADCAGLSSIRVAQGNPSFSSDAAGCLFNKDQTALLLAPMQLSGVYRIPDGVTTVSFEAFFECAGVVGLVIPDSVTDVGDYAFYGCEGLTHVTYSGSPQQWGYIAVGAENTALVQAQTQHYGASPDSVYAYENCVTGGMFCSLCNSFVTSYTNQTGSHSYETVTDMNCGECGYVRTLSTLSLLQEPTVLEYELGAAEPDPAGGVLQATFSDGSAGTVNLTADMITGFDSSTLGEKTLTVSWGGKTVLYKVTVVLGTPDSLELVAFPKTCSYVVGQSVDLTGLELQAQYASVGAVTVTAQQVTLEPVDMVVAGKKTVTVRVGEKAVSFEILVHEKQELTAEPALYPESEHNYAINTDETKTFSYPNAVCLVLTFDDQSYVEGGYDYIYIYDGQNNLVATLTGKLYNEQLTVAGDSVQIRLVSDGSSNRYGYGFASIVAQLPRHSYEDGFCTVCGQLQYGVAVMENGTAVAGGDTVEQALQVYGGNGQYLKLYTNHTVDVTLEQDLYVDLNGHSLGGQIRTNGYKLYGMDSTTDGYTCDKTGVLTCTDQQGEPVLVQTHCRSNGRRYMAVKTRDGYSFHRFYLSITHQTLRPSSDGVGFKAVFYGDELVQEQIDSFGFGLQLGNFREITVSRPGAEFISGKIVTARIENYDVLRHGETPLYAFAVLELTDGTQIRSSQCTMTLRGMLETLNENYVNLTAVQLKAVAAFIKKYTLHSFWNVENLI